MLDADCPEASAYSMRINVALLSPQLLVNQRHDAGKCLGRHGSAALLDKIHIVVPTDFRCRNRQSNYMERCRDLRPPRRQCRSFESFHRRQKEKRRECRACRRSGRPVPVCHEGFAYPPAQFAGLGPVGAVQLLAPPAAAGRSQETVILSRSVIAECFGTAEAEGQRK